MRQAQVPLVDELREAGIAVETAWDLVITATPYSQALPILRRASQAPLPGPGARGHPRAARGL